MPEKGTNVLRPVHASKNLYRSPVRTLLTFILLAVVSFEFFTQTAEYTVTAREITKAAGQYRGVGAVEIDAPNPATPLESYDPEDDGAYLYQYKPLTQEQIAAVSALPYISSSDTRCMTAGISDDFRRMPERGTVSDFMGRCIIQGTLSYINYDTSTLVLVDSSLVFGDLWYKDFKTYVYVGYSADGLGSNGYGRRYMESNMTVGDRYAFVVYADNRSFRESSRTFLGPNAAQPWCPAIWHIDSGAGNYIDTDEFEPLRTLMNILKADMYTFDMVYTDDMSAIMRFATGDMAIQSGRAISPEDSAGGAGVCVISKEFARTYRVGVGDKITMRLGIKLFEQYNGLGALALINPRYAPPGEDAELEIIGVYTDTDEWSKRKMEPNWCYSINTVFVPKALLRVEAGELAEHMYTPAEFSFKVADAWDIPAYINDVAPMLDSMGLHLTLSESGWLEIADNFRQAARLSTIKIIVFSAAVVIATAFAVYLFIGRKKKDYAVMRALGKTSRASAMTLLIPLVSVAAVSVLAGCGAAWSYTIRSIEHSSLLTSLEGYAINTAIPSGVILGSIFGELILTLLLAILLLLRLGALPPLMLLHENTQKQRRHARNTPISAQSILTVPSNAPLSSQAAPFTSADAPLKSKAAPFASADAPLSSQAAPFTSTDAPLNSNNSPLAPLPAPLAANAMNSTKLRNVSFTLSYAWKHMRRAAGKSALTALLALLMFSAAGQLTLMMQSYTDLIENTEITIRFAGGARLSIFPKIVDSGYVRDPYYDVSSFIDINDVTVPIAITNNITRLTGEEFSFTFAEGYDESYLGKIGEIIFIGEDVAEEHGIKPGDTVTVRSPALFRRTWAMYRFVYVIANPDLSEDELLELARDDITEALKPKTDIFTVAGTFTTATGNFCSSVFSAGSLESMTLIATQSMLNVSEFTLKDNLLADDFVDFCYSSIPGVAVGRVAFVMDTSKLKNPENILNLMETLKPILITATLLIGAFLCCLVVLQSSKEAAIMRVLGTRKRLTGSALAIEQAALCLAGLIIGTCALVVFRRQELAAISSKIAVYGALYFAVILAAASAVAWLVTRREVLDLLQTRE